MYTLPITPLSPLTTEDTSFIGTVRDSMILDEPIPLQQYSHGWKHRTVDNSTRRPATYSCVGIGDLDIWYLSVKMQSKKLPTTYGRIFPCGRVHGRSLVQIWTDIVEVGNIVTRTIGTANGYVRDATNTIFLLSSLVFSRVGTTRHARTTHRRFARRETRSHTPEQRKPR